MRKPYRLVWAAASTGVLGVGFALGRGAEPPPPNEKHADEAWLPKRQKAEGVPLENRGGLLIDDPPSAFPELVLPKRNPTDTKEQAFQKNAATYEKMCPRLHGTINLKIDPTDDTLRKLLKARLHQGVLEHRENVRRRGLDCFGDAEHDSYRSLACLTDMQAVAIELWSGRPKELVPWLEEFLIVSKEFERNTRLRAEIGTTGLRTLHAVSRHRLKVEADLWKAKNAK